MVRIQFFLPEGITEEFDHVRLAEGWAKASDLHRAIWLAGWNQYRGRDFAHKKTAPDGAVEDEEDGEA